jgi:outer membrane protein
MKNPARFLLALAIVSSAALVAQAQPAPKIMTVDMAKLYDSHYKTEEQMAKLRGDEQKAQEELDRLNKEGNALVQQFTDLREQTQNPAATAEAKQKAEAAAQAKYQDIQKKQNEVQSFTNNTRGSLQQRINTFKTIMIEEITKLASDVAKRKGATLVFDKSGIGLLGVQTIIYSDAAYDITDDVMKEINLSRPAAAPTAPTAPVTTEPSTLAPTTLNRTGAGAVQPETPAITVPGVPAKK